MATAVVDESTESKEDDLSSVYAQKLENINKIRGTLEELLADLDQHDETLTSGFRDIQSLIGMRRMTVWQSEYVWVHCARCLDKQREKFKNLSIEFDNAQKVNERAKATDPQPDDPETTNPATENTEDVPALEIKLDPIEPLKPLEELELPPKREPITIPPFERTEVDFEFLEQQIVGNEEKKEQTFPFVDVGDEAVEDAAAVDSEHQKADTMLFHSDAHDDDDDQKADRFPYVDIFSDNESEDEHSDAHTDDENDMSEVMISMLEKEKVL